MKKMINGMFYILKFLLLICAFGLSLFIIIRMNVRLEKNILSEWPVFLPFLLLLVVFLINIIFNQKNVTSNLFYNITCCLVLATVILVSLRAVFDENMVLNQKYGYGIDFNFFDNFIAYIKIMFYGLVIGNIFFMFKEKDSKKELASK